MLWSAASFASCGSAFCLVNTDWSVQGAWTESGLRADLRYEYIDLDQPRHGRDALGVGAIPRHHDEVETKNRNAVATLDWGLSPDWGLSIAIPYVDRDHLHIHNHQGEKEPETWHFREVGDVRVQARYEFLHGQASAESLHSAGLTFGVKLPTGRIDVANAQGEQAERTLQPGTGTTDLLLGAHYHAALPLRSLSWFAQAQVVVPMNARDDYKPGKQLHLDGGVRYAAAQDVALMLQLNYHVRGRDRGGNAEPDDSGQRQAFVSPGASWNFARNAQLYAFVQLPVYQNVNGVQLTADRSFVVGVSSRF